MTTGRGVGVCVDGKKLVGRSGLGHVEPSFPAKANVHKSRCSDFKRRRQSPWNSCCGSAAGARAQASRKLYPTPAPEQPIRSPILQSTQWLCRLPRTTTAFLRILTPHPDSLHVLFLFKLPPLLQFAPVNCTEAPETTITMAKVFSYDEGMYHLTTTPSSTQR